MPQREQWRRIPNTNGRYWVSSEGRVRTNNSNSYAMLLKTYKKARYNKAGEINRYYLAVSLCNSNNVRKLYTVSRLVAQAFLFDFNRSSYLLHKDGDYQNCRVDNLIVMTKSNVASLSGYSSKRSRAVRLTYEDGVFAEFRSVRSAAKAIPCSYQTLLDYIAAKRKNSVLDQIKVSIV